MSVPERDRIVENFLASKGFVPRDARPLAQDASFRRYSRVGGAILMDAPPPEDVRPFLRMADHLASLGLSVPQIIAADQPQGLILEEDLGDDLFSATLTDANGETLFDAALDALVVMHQGSRPDLPAWGKAAMMETTLGTLFDWWWPAMHGADAAPEARAEVATALGVVLDHLGTGPGALVHRDFFAGNLLWLPDRTGPRRVGIIDFQSAAIGHPAYDLVSLVQDARRDIPVEWEKRAVARYLNARPEIVPADFHAAYAACAVQRHLRVACQWVRLAKRDGRPQYAAHGPRTWRLLTRALAEPAARPLAIALDRWVPNEQRRNPPGLSNAD